MKTYTAKKLIAGMLNMNKYETQLLLVAILIGLHVFSQAKPGGKTERPSKLSGS